MLVPLFRAAIHASTPRQCLSRSLAAHTESKMESKVVSLKDPPSVPLTGSSSSTRPISYSPVRMAPSRSERSSETHSSTCSRQRPPSSNLTPPHNRRSACARSPAPPPLRSCSDTVFPDSLAGLVIRILGPVTCVQVQLLQRADVIYLEEIRAAGLYQQISQAFAVLLPVRANWPTSTPPLTCHVMYYVMFLASQATVHQLQHIIPTVRAALTVSAPPSFKLRFLRFSSYFISRVNRTK
ncbi:hypothetical protein EDB86DRAFT_2320016 [Lactarius hatsudake]|nr:hypothetical protein EDB86DRAFT_2320016 [Lactarius hatsudake]